MTNKRTWFSHLFRTQGGDFSFPYPLKGSDVDRARKYSRHLWMDGKWPHAVRTLRSVLDQFWPVPGWTEEQRDALGSTDVVPCESAAVHVKRPSAGIVYYSDNRPEQRILDAVRATVDLAGLPVVAVTLAPIDWPSATNIVLNLERGYLTMFQQMLAGIEACRTELVYFCEHDVLYHPSHFRAAVPDLHTVSYNANVWKVDVTSGRALHYRCNQTSGLCGYREHLLNHYRARVQRVAQLGYQRTMGFEPGTRQVANGGFDDYGHVTWMSEAPNVDLRHGHNLTPSRWRKDQFRNQAYTEGWTEGEGVPGWGRTLGRMEAFLQDALASADRQLVA